MSFARTIEFDSSLPVVGQRSRAALLTPIVLCIWILTLLTFSPPEDYRQSHYGPAPIAPPAVLKMTKFAGRGLALAITSFALLSTLPGIRGARAIRVLFPFLLFAAYGVVSTVWSPLPTVTFTQSGSFFLLTLLALYTASAWSDEEDTEQLLKHLVFVLFSLSLLLLAIHFAMPRAGALTRLSAGILHTTNASATAALGIVLMAAGRLVWQSSWSKWWPVVVPINALVVLIAGNRLSLILTVLLVILLSLFYARRIVLAAYGLIGSLTTLLYLCLDPKLILVEKIAGGLGFYVQQGQTSVELASLSGRSEMWAKMWRSVQDAPITGHGFFVTSSTGRILVWDEWGNWTAHNLALQILTTTGIVGAGLLLAGFAYLAVGIVRNRHASDANKRTIATVAVIGLWFLGWGILNEAFMGPLQPESVVFAVLLGIAAGVSAGRWDPSTHPQPSLSSEVSR